MYMLSTFWNIITLVTSEIHRSNQPFLFHTQFYRNVHIIFINTTKDNGGTTNITVQGNVQGNNCAIRSQVENGGSTKIDVNGDVSSNSIAIDALSINGSNEINIPTSHQITATVPVNSKKNPLDVYLAQTGKSVDLVTRMTIYSVIGAPKNGTVSINAERLLNPILVHFMLQRQDLTYILSFDLGNDHFVMTIPSNSDLSQYVNKKEELDLANLISVFPNTKEPRNR